MKLRYLIVDGWGSTWGAGGDASHRSLQDALNAYSEQGYDLKFVTETVIDGVPSTTAILELDPHRAANLRAMGGDS